MIALLIILFLANSLYIFGLHNAARFEFVSEDHPFEYGIVEQSKMILWRFRYFCLKRFGKFYSKPLITCPPCMAGVHSLYIYWPLVICLYGFRPVEILIYVIYAGALSGFNYLMMLLIEMIESVRDKNNNT